MADWERYRFMAESVQRLFSYFDRMWIKDQRRRGRIDVYDTYTVTISFLKDHPLMATHTITHQSFQLAIMKWRSEVLQKFTEDRFRLDYWMIHLIDRQRDGSFVDISLLKEIVESLVHLGANDSSLGNDSLLVYKEAFESKFLSATAKYYRIWSSSFVATKSMATYLAAVEDRLRDERIRAHWFLHFSTVGLLNTCCVKALISDPAECISEAFRVFLERGEDEPMQQAYNIMALVSGGLASLRSVFMLHVKNQALHVIRSAVNDLHPTANTIGNTSWIESLIQLHRRFIGIISDNFRGDIAFRASLDMAYQDSINQNAITGLTFKTSSELLAKEFDFMLRKRHKRIYESNFDERLDQLVSTRSIFVM